MADKADMKIVDLVSQMWKRKEKFLSLEFFPSHSSAGRENLVMRIKAMIRLSRVGCLNFQNACSTCIHQLNELLFVTMRCSRFL